MSKRDTNPKVTMTYQEFFEWAQRYIADRVITDGFTGIGTALHAVLHHARVGEEYGWKQDKKNVSKA